MERLLGEVCRENRILVQNICSKRRAAVMEMAAVFVVSDQVLRNFSYTIEKTLKTFPESFRYSR